MKYKIGDKIKFYDGFDEVEVEILTKKGADAINRHNPKSYSGFKKIVKTPLFPDSPAAVDNPWKI